jgi:hypothetical protein
MSSRNAAMRRPVASQAQARSQLLSDLYDNGGPGHGAITPTFGLTALATLFGRATNLIIGLQPIVLTAVVGYFLVHCWLAAEGAPGQGHRLAIDAYSLPLSTRRRGPNCFIAAALRVYRDPANGNDWQGPDVMVALGVPDRRR